MERSLQGSSVVCIVWSVAFEVPCRSESDVSDDAESTIVNVFSPAMTDSSRLDGNNSIEEGSTGVKDSLSSCTLDVSEQMC